MSDGGDARSFETIRAEVVVIGSGFGGAVAACRLALAGFDVLLVERGRRFTPGSFPAMPSAQELLPDASRWTYAHDRGLWDAVDLGSLRVVQAAGYGGGSLIYANVHLRPDADFFERDFHPEFEGANAREELERCFDRVAAMLDVSIYPDDLARRTPKTRALDVLGAEGTISPPLAVNFEALETGQNAFGIEQQPCNGCGACCTGCNVGAKNSLDKNYLALAERAGTRIRTSTEAIRIERWGGSRYRIHVHDHLAGGALSYVEAEHVFVCAGAVHTTRLLAKSFGDELPAIGRKFFGNGDAIAMIHGADAKLEPQRGPTITRAIVHRPLGELGPWFMVQDGGYAEALHHAFGMMRAPLLTGLNRFEERSERSFVLPQIEPWEEAKSLDTRGSVHASWSTVLLRGLDDERFLARLTPPWLRAALGRLLARLRRAESEVIGETIDRIPGIFVDVFRDELLREGKSSGASAALKLLCARFFATTMRSMLRMPTFRNALVESSRLGFEGAIGIEPSMEKTTKRVLVRALGMDLASSSEPRGDDPSRRLMLLAMGDDRRTRRTLRLDGERLVALTEGNDPIYALEERAFRDIASAVGGELRVNPLYALENETITVHAQGGCGMGVDRVRGVTDHDGSVHGFPGIFVLDAAAFPKPVGVNPSATIAALAERNASRFIERESSDAHRARAAALKARFPFGEDFVRAVLAKPSKATTLTQLRIGRDKRAKPLVSKPIGLRFSETMVGFVASEGGAPTTLDDYESLAARGRDLGASLELRLRASIEDMTAFARSRRHLVRLSGSVTFREGLVKRTFELDPAHCRLALMREERGGAARSMIYSLHGNGVHIFGQKKMDDAVGFDAWEDTTRLFVRMRVDGAVKFGIVRLSMEDFLREMLPSFEVSGTDDDARRLAAIASFGSFFFSNLQRVYLPTLPDLMKLAGGSR